MLNDPSSCLRLKTGSGKDVGQQSEFKDRVNVENSGGLLTHELFDNLKNRLPQECQPAPQSERF